MKKNWMITEKELEPNIARRSLYERFPKLKDIWASANERASAKSEDIDGLQAAINSIIDNEARNRYSDVDSPVCEEYYIVLTNYHVFIPSKYKLIVCTPTGIIYQNITRGSLIIYDNIKTDDCLFEITLQGIINVISNPFIAPISVKRHLIPQKLDTDYFNDCIHDAAMVEDIIVVSAIMNSDASSLIFYENKVYGSKNHYDLRKWHSFYNDNEGSGITLFNKITGKTLISYRFWDEWYSSPMLIAGKTKDFVIFNREEVSYIINLNNFSVLSFGGYEFTIVGSQVLIHHYWGYYYSTHLELIDTNINSRLDLTTVQEFLFGKYGQIIYENFSLENHILYYNIEGEKLSFNMFDFSNTAIGDLSMRATNSPMKFPIYGNWTTGYSIDEYTVKCLVDHDGCFHLKRTPIGQMFYELKHCLNRTYIDDLVKLVIKFLKDNYMGVYVVVPIPPSKLDRAFQPLAALVQCMEESSDFNVNLNYLKKSITPEIKTLKGSDAKRNVLEHAFSVPDDRYKGKHVLLFDDHYNSGETLKAATEILRTIGGVKNISVLTIVKS